MEIIPVLVVNIISTLLIIVFIRTFFFASRQPAVAQGNILIDTGAVVQKLSKALQIRTISYDDPEKIDYKNFEHFRKFLEEAFPLVHQNLEKKTINEHSMVFTCKGTDPTLKPVLLLAHYDVVPVETGTEGEWKYPPFSGSIAEGYVWGRGALDDKIAIISILEAVELHLKQNTQPKRTIILAFGHDEEIGGWNGAAKLASHLEQEKITPEFILDEGLAVTHELVPGKKVPVALIGIAEKASVSYKISIEMEGGHSSTPPKSSALQELVNGIHKIGEHPFKVRITKPVQAFFNFLGPEMPFLKKLVFANQWLFKPLLIRSFTKTASGNALVRTILTPTILKSGLKDNIVPAKATAILNARILPGETSNEVLQHLRKIMDTPGITIQKIEPYHEPTPVASFKSASFDLISQTIKEIFNDTIIAPSLVLGTTDSRHYLNLTSNIFRFSPIRINPQNLKTIHGRDERISTKNIGETVNFYFQLIARFA